MSHSLSIVASPVSTERPQLHPIHLLNHVGVPLCGAKAFTRAWNVCAWPSLPWADACAACQEERFRPAVRPLLKEVAHA
jgi:hypothetical protein